MVVNQFPDTHSKIQMGDCVVGNKKGIGWFPALSPRLKCVKGYGLLGDDGGVQCLDGGIKTVERSGH